MGTVRIPSAVCFFSSVIFRESGILTEVEIELARLLGPIFEKTPPERFSHSDYYYTEMGEDLMRSFLLFEPLQDRERLAEIKLETNHIEQRYAQEGRRTVNIDPGYLALEHVVLGTTKGFSHRIYQSRGIYADLTLMFRDGSYTGLEWTYPDYRGPGLISLLNRWREYYKRWLRCQKA